LESTVKFFADDCVKYVENMNDSDIKTSQIRLDRLGEWAAEYTMNINPGTSKARVRDSLIIFGGTKEFHKRAAANI